MLHCRLVMLFTQHTLKMTTEKKDREGRGVGPNSIRITHARVEVPIPRKLTHTHRLKIDNMCAIGCDSMPYHPAFLARPWEGHEDPIPVVVRNQRRGGS